MYHTFGTKTGFDLWVLPLEGERKQAPFLQTEFDEVLGQFSPDGKWIAYASNETGRYEVYVRSFPSSGGKWQMSTGGGSRPRWCKDGKELCYLAPNRKLMAVDVKTASAVLEAGQPKELFQTSAADLPEWMGVYDVTADGKRFLIISAQQESTASPITVVQNWTAGLKK